jgi:hypothetical protein
MVKSNRMGKITDELVALIMKQLQDRGIVVWYDPEHAYADVVSQLDQPGTTVLRYEGSFFDLRHRLEPLLEFLGEDGRFHANLETPPRLLLYVPVDRTKTQHALIEAEAARVVMEPGASPWQRNTRLKVLAERVFKGIAPDQASAIAAEVEAGRRTLAELDWLADQTGEWGALKLIFGTTAVADVVLAFLSCEAYDNAMLEKQALPELASLCSTELGLRIHSDQPVGQLRHELCRSLLLAELTLRVGAAGGDTSRLAAMPLPDAARACEQLLAVCQQWRNRLDLRESYAAWAHTVQTEAQVLGLGLQAPTLMGVETFASVEPLLLDWAEVHLLDGAVSDALDLIGRRKASFWSLYTGEYQLRWTLLELAAQLLLTAARVETELKSVRKDAKVMVEAYTRGIPGAGSAPAMPWYLLDREHRHLEHRYTLLDLHLEGQHAQLETLMASVRRRYRATRRTSCAA